MKLTAENVTALFNECTWQDTDTADKGLYSIALDVWDLLASFHPGRLQNRRRDIIALLEQLPRVFFTQKQDGGGGERLDKAIVSKDGKVWGTKREVQELFLMAAALDIAKHQREFPPKLLPRAKKTDPKQVAPKGAPIYFVDTRPENQETGARE